jgi:CubicO group peptidase (beta-lactamase class C family)
MTQLPERNFRNALPVILLAVLVSAASAQAPSDRLKQVVQPYADAQMFMGSVLVAKNGKIIFSQSYGMADLEWSVPNSATTRFNIASMTKQFTAASILLLEDRGKLKTDDLVRKYLPEAPASWDKITIYHLLTHTSGIREDAAEYEPGTPDKLVLVTSLSTFSRAKNGNTPTRDTSCSGTCWKGSADRPTRNSFTRIFSNRWG